MLWLQKAWKLVQINDFMIGICFKCHQVRSSRLAVTARIQLQPNYALEPICQNCLVREHCCGNWSGAHLVKLHLAQPEAFPSPEHSFKAQVAWLDNLTAEQNWHKIWACCLKQKQFWPTNRACSIGHRTQKQLWATLAKKKKWCNNEIIDGGRQEQLHPQSGKFGYSRQRHETV